jgi:hypothetical protein
MRTKTRESATREDLLWEMDKKTAALKRIHRLCNEMSPDDQEREVCVAIKRIRYIAGANYPSLEPQAGDRLEIKAQ